MARRYFPHIYFESKKPGKDSVYEAVPDLGRPGVRSAKEVKLLAAATVADLADGKTVNHHGRRVRFTKKLLSGRFLVLSRLAKRFGGKSAVKKAKKFAFKIYELPKRERKKAIKKFLVKELGISVAMAEQLIARTNAGRSRSSKSRRSRRKSTRRKRKRR